jgi:hypothetical protein
VNLVWAHGAYAATWRDNTADSRVHFVRISRDGERQGEERIFTR